MEIVLSIGLIILFFYLMLKKQFNVQQEIITTQRAQASVYTYKKIYHRAGYVGVLHVSGKSETAIKALEFSEIHDINVTTKPDQLVYTGATVGGVTTGGFHVEKGGTFASVGRGTGRWAVNYRFASEFNSQPWSETITYMQLDNRLFAEAKQDAILRNLIVTDKEREQWKKEITSVTDKLIDVPCLLTAIGMDENTAMYLKKWLAGRTSAERLQKEKSRDKNNFKYAVIGGIVAGPAGAVIGAIAEKNKVSNEQENK